jgi:hypothetical protein
MLADESLESVVPDNCIAWQKLCTSSSFIPFLTGPYSAHYYFLSIIFALALVVIICKSLFPPVFFMLIPFELSFLV